MVKKMPGSIIIADKGAIRRVALKRQDAEEGPDD